ncbi:MAG: hypothetical protein AAFY34_11770 [Pseudomonadota bacterium]
MTHSAIFEGLRAIRLAGNLHLRVVLPIAIRAKEAPFDVSDRKSAQCILVDWRRRAEFLGRPRAWPNPDAVVQNDETMEVSKDRPHRNREQSGPRLSKPDTGVCRP